MQKNIILCVECRDQKGLVATITNFIFHNNGNIISLDQHTNPAEEKFFMRAEWEEKGFALSRDRLALEIKALTQRFGMKYQLFYRSEKPRVAILVSKYDHCLFDLLLRVRSGELVMEIPCIISNHPDLEDVARMFGIPFLCFPASEDTSGQEALILKALKDAKIDLIVLARYMRILSCDFIKEYPFRIINVHHSFLPAFSGARPYHQAYERGVKVIGATSHFVTEELDAGPIIEQETIKISHEDDVEDLILKGRDLERKVLAQAVQLYIQHRLFVDGQRTIIL